MRSTTHVRIDAIWSGIYYCPLSEVAYPQGMYNVENGADEREYSYFGRGSLPDGRSRCYRSNTAILNSERQRDMSKTALKILSPGISIITVADRSAKVNTRVGDGDGGWKREGRYEGECDEGFVAGALIETCELKEGVSYSVIHILFRSILLR